MAAAGGQSRAADAFTAPDAFGCCASSLHGGSGTPQKPAFPLNAAAAHRRRAHVHHGVRRGQHGARARRYECRRGRTPRGRPRCYGADGEHGAGGVGGLGG